MEDDQIALAHEFIGMMIAAKCSSVTITLYILEGAGMIRSLLGRVIILYPAKLIDLAWEGYGMPEAQ